MENLKPGSTGTSWSLVPFYSMLLGKVVESFSKPNLFLGKVHWLNLLILYLAVACIHISANFSEITLHCKINVIKNMLQYYN